MYDETPRFDVSIPRMPRYFDPNSFYFEGCNYTNSFEVLVCHNLIQPSNELVTILIGLVISLMEVIGYR